MDHKRPFDVDRAIQRIRDAVRGFPKAAMFALADEGFATPFELLVACMISIRTRDEVTMVCARRLFGLAQTPEQMSRLTAEQIDAAIGASTFHEPKARQIREISRRILQEHQGDLRAPTDVLGGDQPPARPLRQARLHRQAAAVLDLPCAGHVPPGGCDSAPLMNAAKQAVAVVLPYLAEDPFNLALYKDRGQPFASRCQPFAS